MIKKNKWKILVTGPICLKAKKMIEAKAELIFIPPYSSSEEIAELVKKQQTEGLIVRMGKITREVLAASSQLQVVIKHGTGFNNIDIAAATKLGLPVLITPNANFEAVAEHTVSLIYGLAKKLTFLDYELRVNHNWYKTKTEYQTKELHHKCLGIIGFGRIGSRVIQLVTPLEMKILVYDPYVSEKDLPNGTILVKSLKEFLQKADIITIHCPLTKDTYHLLGEEELSYMKPNAYLVNTARGGVIDERALVNVLKKGLIAGAALDTFEKEPPSFNSDIFKLNNLITTAHIAGNTKESFIRMGVTVAETIFKFLEEKEKEIEKSMFVNNVIKKQN